MMIFKLQFFFLTYDIEHKHAQLIISLDKEDLNIILIIQSFFQLWTVSLSHILQVMWDLLLDMENSHYWKKWRQNSSPRQIHKPRRIRLWSQASCCWILRGCVFTGFLSVYVLTPAKWDTVGRASVWNERSRAGTGQSSEESACVFHRHKDNPSVSRTLKKTTLQNMSVSD